MSHPVFWFHLPSEFVQPVLILIEDFGHTADGEDVGRRGHDSAAFDAGSASPVPGQEFIEPGRRVIG
jgi:hypothetical protein